ncbi:histone acetyltransferase subunit NuA4-domain-containing protein [Achaetomium macrosporum]|uniref:Chromatin modification-related protein EAF6 n=1 Tax=Achaetomium macrosporum TaxID=79813 RepID=A0AAN7C408_9PEZI|nr:histone acetyltransferase subunit NuA4-domain-containing protein [Achaetomium macrosporum]
MAENVAPSAASAKPSGGNAAASPSPATSIPVYEEQRQHLKELINHRRMLEKQLAATEEHIVLKETEYLESTPGGNIIVGFDNYTKGTSTAAAQRRKTGLTDQNRVFSRSSVSYNAAAADAQTPGSSHAPTPMSSSFGNNGGGASSAPTPASASGAGGGGRAATSKKNKKSGGAVAAAAAAAAAEDSETDGRETKKVRTSFGARK